MPTALVFGYYGRDNAGDDAMLQAIAQKFKALGVKTIAVSHDPEKTMRDFGIEAIGHDADLSKVNYDFFVLGGGTQIQDYRPEGFERLVEFFLRAKRPGVKACLLGIGATELKTGKGKRLARTLCENSDLIIMRDKEGKAELEKAGVRKRIHVSSDLTFALSEKASQKRNNAILFCPIPYYEIYELTPEKDKGLAEELANAIDLVAASTKAKISLLPFFKSFDTAFCEMVLSMVKSKGVKIVPYKPLGVGLTKTFEKFDLVVGMRFHSLVFSAFLGKPFVAVALTEKTKSLVRDFSWEKFSVGPGFKAAELAEKTLGLFRKQEKASLLIGKKRQELKQKALRAFVLFEEKLLLAGGKG